MQSSLTKPRHLAPNRRVEPLEASASWKVRNVLVAPPTRPLLVPQKDNTDHKSSLNDVVFESSSEAQQPITNEKVAGPAHCSHAAEQAVHAE